MVVSWTLSYAFDGSPVHDVKVRLVTNTNHTLESFFIQKKISARNVNQNGINIDKVYLCRISYKQYQNHFEIKTSILPQ